MWQSTKLHLTLQLDDCRLQWLQSQRPHQNQRKDPAHRNLTEFLHSLLVVKLFETTECQSILWNDCLASTSIYATIEGSNVNAKPCNQARVGAGTGTKWGAICKLVVDVEPCLAEIIQQSTKLLLIFDAALWLSKCLTSGPSFTIPTQMGSKSQGSSQPTTENLTCWLLRKR
jgi:hypothetical protein